ncbi:site-specific integrase [Streptomyces varsoviensis]|uniref:tyrosine-type recombinase/integrase n=1 Tax=Streptomyces varsoviensis TaxID=67373 RepID=UPI0033CB84CF
MAYIQERPQTNGPTTYQVRWKEGGGRHGPGQSERFDDPDAAENFKKLVDAHGQHWPYGWVKGEGFVEQPKTPGDQPLVPFAERYVHRLTNVDDRTQDDYEREIRLHLSLIQHTEPSGHVVPATVCNVTKDDITDWIHAEKSGQPDPSDPKKWLRKPADPKSIANRHGLAFCIFQSAIEATPQLRTTNPCKGTSLPRTDDHVDEEMTFLEHAEYQRIADEFTDPDARDLADWLVGTGMRWGEATALKVKDVNLNGATPTVSVQRAWRRSKKGSDSAFHLGPPKTKRARRVLRLSPTQEAMMRRLTAGQWHEAYVFRTVTGKHWRHANYYNRKWQPAVKAAVAKGLPKSPRIHDLRHTCASWLIAARIPLPAIQRRLGHESISTTVDRYGHLLSELDDDIAAAVEIALTGPAPKLRVVPAS